MGNKPVNGMNLDVNETILETINSDGFHFRYWFYHKMKPEYQNGFEIYFILSG